MARMEYEGLNFGKTQEYTSRQARRRKTVKLRSNLSEVEEAGAGNGETEFPIKMFDSKIDFMTQSELCRYKELIQRPQS